LFLALSEHWPFFQLLGFGAPPSIMVIFST
jgi:hypothetical protein